MSEKNLKTTQETDSSIKWYSYVALIVGVVFFSGIFAASDIESECRYLRSIVKQITK